MNEIKYIETKIETYVKDVETYKKIIKDKEIEINNLIECKKAILQNNGWKDEARNLLSKLIDENKTEIVKNIGETIKCSSCNQIKTIDNFYIRKDTKSGRHGQCKECRKEYFDEYKRKKRLHKKLKSHPKPIATISNVNIYLDTWNEFENKFCDGRYHKKREIIEFLKNNKHYLDRKESSYKIYLSKFIQYAKDKKGYYLDSKEFLDEDEKEIFYCFNQKEKNLIITHKQSEPRGNGIYNGTEQETPPLIASGTKDKRSIIEKFSKFKLRG